MPERFNSTSAAQGSAVPEELRSTTAPAQAWANRLVTDKEAEEWEGRWGPTSTTQRLLATRNALMGALEAEHGGEAKREWCQLCGLLAQLHGDTA